MAALRARWLTAVVLALAAVGLLGLVACGDSADSTSTPVSTIQATLLVHVNEDDERWFRDVDVPKGTDAYELTELVMEGDLESTWYPAYRAHFVDSIVGVENSSPHFWLIYQWSESEATWEPLPVGADRFSVKEGDALAWAYADTGDTGYHEKLTEPLSPADS